MDVVRRLNKVHAQLRACRLCPNMCGSAVHGPAIETPILLIGQAPGSHEGALGRPFAYTAGKTLFKWLKEATGEEEAELRELIYFSAVARCFPGKAASGAGDREPTAQEIESCRVHLMAEVEALQPKLILAVGKVAIREVLGAPLFRKTTPLSEVVGQKFRLSYHGVNAVVIPLPHPSGVSRWPQTEPGKTKLSRALRLVRQHFTALQI